MNYRKSQHLKMNRHDYKGLNEAEIAFIELFNALHLAETANARERDLLVVGVRCGMSEGGEPIPSDGPVCNEIITAHKKAALRRKGKPSAKLYCEADYHTSGSSFEDALIDVIDNQKKGIGAEDF